MENRFHKKKNWIFKIRNGTSEPMHYEEDSSELRNALPTRWGEGTEGGR